MNKKKVYIRPYSEVVLVNGKVCDDVHDTIMSRVNFGDGTETPIGYGNDEGDAKDYSWNLWDDLEADNW